MASIRKKQFKELQELNAEPTPMTSGSKDKAVGRLPRPEPPPKPPKPTKEQIEEVIPVMTFERNPADLHRCIQQALYASIDAHVAACDTQITRMKCGKFHARDYAVILRSGNLMVNIYSYIGGRGEINNNGDTAPGISLSFLERKMYLEKLKREEESQRQLVQSEEEL